MRIALDAMGGDYAPKNTVEGAVLAPILHTLTRMTGLVVAKSLVRSDFRRIRGDDVLEQPVFQAP